MSGQYNNPVRVVAFNTASTLPVDVLPSSLERFVERHLGPERQLTLRLA
jgi:hypothetical protein